MHCINNPIKFRSMLINVIEKISVIINLQIFLFQPQSIAFRDKHGKTALHYCAESGALPCAQLLVSGADRTLLDAPDSEGFTPLHLAVISGHKSIARLLLRAGADPDSVDKERHSVVHWAAG